MCRRFSRLIHHSSNTTTHNNNSSSSSNHRLRLRLRLQLNSIRRSNKYQPAHRGHLCAVLELVAAVLWASALPVALFLPTTTAVYHQLGA